jgi:hypothetical protein
MLGAIGGLGALTIGVLRTSGDEETLVLDSPSSSASASPASSPTAAVTPLPTSTPTLVPAKELKAYRAIFVRNPVVRDEQGGGELWIGILDGSNVRRLTGQGEAATLAGTAKHPRTGGEAVYFVSLDDGTTRTVWTVDTGTGERLNLFTFESRRDADAHAAISPDGRYVAYAHVGGIDIRDLTSGQDRHLLDNGPNPCDPSNCMNHSRPKWSPDGKLLLVRRGFW